MDQFVVHPSPLPGRETLLARFGTPAERVETALASLRAGGGVIVVDDDDRENEGDIIFPASTVSVEQMALLIRECSGIVCLVLPEATTSRLGLAPMVTDNTSRYGTAFTVSIEARTGVTTGVSAADRVQTIRAAIAPGARPDDLAHPGHIFPLRAHPQGLAARQGHTEATLELMIRAGLTPAGVLCEVTNPDGTMARLPELMPLSEEYHLPIVSIADLVATA